MKKIKALMLGVIASLVAFSGYTQDSYPDKPIRWVVPNPAGGGTDAVVRTLSNAMAPSLGKPIVIENKPGAATMIGADTVARSKPDGYTLLTGDNATFATNVHLYKKLTYDPVKDFSYINLTTRFPLVLAARSNFPAKNIAELIQYAKANPGKINFATPGAGLPHHLAMELFMEQTGAQMTHIAYKGSPAAVQDMMAGQVDVMFLDVASGMGFIKDGRIKTFGTASMKRFESLPDVPTLHEQGVEKFEVYAWQGVVVPAGTPNSVVKKLNKEFEKVLQDPTVRKKLLEIGVEPIWSTPEQFIDYARAERERWGKLISAKGLKLD
ncbi:Bug family tripartite tricarboxylate transporter substrate binding protein [Hydrogenophaga sp.]|uniref:Bug family tripartite tricarboxylate transporter substrate binding protein n=1 Tax=Hydrogenophaga sp. TaxID=1904254 RepID=UPI00391A9A3D